MKDLYEHVIIQFAHEYRIKCESPLTIVLSLINYDVVRLIDKGSHWRVKCQDRIFIVKTPGVLGLRLALVQALTVSEEVACVTDILLAAGYTKLDPLHFEWRVFMSPDGYWVSISPGGENDDPRCGWRVGAHDESVRSFVREVCMGVKGFDNVI